MKELYQEAEMELIRLQAIDIITTSGNPGGDEEEDELPQLPVGG